jgi:hypothetical protein
MTIRIRKARAGIRNRKNVVGLQNPQSHSFLPKDSIKFQYLVTSSSNFITNEFGIPISSVKKTSELKTRKIVSIGAKIRFPINVSIDICRPQPTRIGIEASVTINCDCVKFSKYFFMLFQMLDGFIIDKLRLAKIKIKQF